MMTHEKALQGSRNQSFGCGSKTRLKFRSVRRCFGMLQLHRVQAPHARDALPQRRFPSSMRCAWFHVCAHTVSDAMHVASRQCVADAGLIWLRKGSVMCGGEIAFTVWCSSLAASPSSELQCASTSSVRPRHPHFRIRSTP